MHFIYVFIIIITVFSFIILVIYFSISACTEAMQIIRPSLGLL